MMFLNKHRIHFSKNTTISTRANAFLHLRVSGEGMGMVET